LLLSAVLAKSKRACSIFLGLVFFDTGATFSIIGSDFFCFLNLRKIKLKDFTMCSLIKEKILKEDWKKRSVNETRENSTREINVMINKTSKMIYVPALLKKYKRIFTIMEPRRPPAFSVSPRIGTPLLKIRERRPATVRTKTIKPKTRPFFIIKAGLKKYFKASNKNSIGNRKELKPKRRSKESAV